MIVIVNGEKRDVEAGTSIQDLLNTLDLDSNALVVQHNEDIVDKSDYGRVQLDENDQLEFIQFVGGG